MSPNFMIQLCITQVNSARSTADITDGRNFLVQNCTKNFWLRYLGFINILQGRVQIFKTFALLNTPVSRVEFFIELKRYRRHFITQELSKSHKLIKWCVCVKAFPHKKLSCRILKAIRLQKTVLSSWTKLIMFITRLLSTGGRKLPFGNYSDRKTLVEGIFRDWTPRSCDHIELPLDYFRLCRPRDLSYVHFHIILEVVFLSLLF